MPLNHIKDVEPLEHWKGWRRLDSGIKAQWLQGHQIQRTEIKITWSYLLMDELRSGAPGQYHFGLTKKMLPKAAIVRVCGYPYPRPGIWHLSLYPMGPEPAGIAGQIQGTRQTSLRHQRWHKLGYLASWCGICRPPPTQSCSMIHESTE